MGLLKTLLFVIALYPPYLSYKVYDAMYSNHPVPDIKDEAWGPGSQPGVGVPDSDTSIRPFKVDFTSPKILNDLKSRLKGELERGFMPPLEGVGFGYGFNTGYLKSLMTYWMEKYDFTAREKELNKYPSFKTKIGGLDIHFQHIKPSKEVSKKYKTTVPIILIHGWPGSFVEHQKLIPLLLEPKDSEMNFEIVVPSLPGYGFSTASSRPGLYHAPMANIFGRLMTRLGYDQYYALGEDWGTFVVSDMAMLFPQRVKGIHTACVTFHPWDALRQFVSYLLNPVESFYGGGRKLNRALERFYPYHKIALMSLMESGYVHIQATKPDTVGVALTQSPSGLAAYILEKFATWTNDSYGGQDDGGLGRSKFTKEDLLDNVMVYWVSGSITSAMRLYSEAFNRWAAYRVPVSTPAACINTPEDVLFLTKEGLSAKYPNLQKLTTPEVGGHFAAYEIPQVVAKEAVGFFNDLEFNQRNTAKK